MRKFYPFSLASDITNENVKHITADFETCLNEDGKDVHVWAWGLADIFTEDFEHGTTIESFLARLLNDKHIYDVAFHNLKFDGNFILPALYKMGFQYMHNRVYMNKWKEGADLTGYFTHSISENGQFYNIIVTKSQVADRKTPAFIYFWDSLKLFPESLKEVGEHYNRVHFKIEEPRGFYEAIRPVGHIPTEHELLYLKEDCLVLAEALREQIEKYGKIYRTRASKAFSFFKECCVIPNTTKNVYEDHYVGSKDFRVPLIEGFEDFEGATFRYLPAKIKKHLIKEKLIPEFNYHIPDFPTWQDLKASYRGGISYVNPVYQEQSIEDFITVIDVNSMYPYCMKNFNVPYGSFVKREGKPTEETGTWIACARVSFKLKETYNLPCIQIKEKYGREWLRESTDYKEHGELDPYNEDIIWFTKVDYETYNLSYDFVVHDWIEYYYFAMQGAVDGDNFVTKYYNAKQEATERANAIKKRYNYDPAYKKDPDYIKAMLDRQEAKIIMNSAYGKHGTKYIMLSQDTVYHEGEPLEFPIDRKIFNSDPEDPSHYYLPYASFITSYARQMLVRTWNSFKGKALYCDTDSIHYLGKPSDIPEELKPSIDWDSTGELGLWSFESDEPFIAGRYLRAKTYIEVDANGESHVTCAGATKDVKKLMNWDTFRVGFNAWAIALKQGLEPKDYSKLTPKRYPSGVQLVIVNFEIKPLLKLTRTF